MAFKKTNHPTTSEEAKKFAEIAIEASRLPFITEEQAAVLLQVSMPQMARMRKQYKLPAMLVGNRTYRYPREELILALKTVTQEA